jgi:hypothetical protein
MAQGGAMATSSHLRAPIGVRQEPTTFRSCGWSSCQLPSVDDWQRTLDREPRTDGSEKSKFLVEI